MASLARCIISTTIPNPVIVNIKKINRDVGDDDNQYDEDSQTQFGLFQVKQNVFHNYSHCRASNLIDRVGNSNSEIYASF